MKYKVAIIQWDGFYPQLYYKSKNKNIKNETFVVVNLNGINRLGKVVNKAKENKDENIKEIIKEINLLDY